jgi:hypothetical protein
MVTPKLTVNAVVSLDLRRSRGSLAAAGAGEALRAALTCTAALLAAGAITAIAGTIDPALAPSTPPHPTLHPTLAAAGAILVNNARVLALPYGLLLLRLENVRWGRTLGSALVVGVLAVNAVTVGLALGRWHGRLIPYLPHLPLESAAAGVAASVWARALARRHRDPCDCAQGADGRAASLTAAITLLLLAAAAAVEVLLTPHAA